MKMGYDKIVETISSLGVPGLVLLITISISGYAGAAAITASLALLGGPLGMLGGVGVLGLLVIITRAVAEFGIEKIFIGVVGELIKKGENKETIIKKIESYRISKSLKSKLIEFINNHEF